MIFIWPPRPCVRLDLGRTRGRRLSASNEQVISTLITVSERSLLRSTSLVRAASSRLPLSGSEFLRHLRSVPPSGSATRFSSSSLLRRYCSYDCVASPASLFSSAGAPPSLDQHPQFEAIQRVTGLPPCATFLRRGFDDPPRLHGAVDAAFAAFGTVAVYTPAGGDPVPVRVIARRPDAIVGFGETRIHAETATFEVRASGVATPRPTTSSRSAARGSSCRASRSGGIRIEWSGTLMQGRHESSPHT